MKAVSTTELRSRTSSIVRLLERGQALSLTHRGRGLANIFPTRAVHRGKASDPLYSFHKFAGKLAAPLTDREIDAIVYGQ